MTVVAPLNHVLLPPPDLLGSNIAKFLVGLSINKVSGIQEPIGKKLLPSPELSVPGLPAVLKTI